MLAEKSLNLIGIYEKKINENLKKILSILAIGAVFDMKKYFLVPKTVKIGLNRY